MVSPRRESERSPPRWPQPRRSVDTRAHNRADLTRDGFPEWPVLNRLLVGLTEGARKLPHGSTFLLVFGAFFIVAL